MGSDRKMDSKTDSKPQPKTALRNERHRASALSILHFTTPSRYHNKKTTGAVWNPFAVECLLPANRTRPAERREFE
jgi:hypothetical protein